MSEQKRESKQIEYEVMKKRKIYSGSFKAKVVLESIKGEKSLLELADQYQLNPNQIKNWKSIFLRRAGDILEDGRRKRKGDE